MKEPGPDHPITIVKSAGRVRVRLAGVTIAETDAALVLTEASYPPVFYIPRADARWDLFAKSARRTHCPYKGDASYFGLTVGTVSRPDAVWSYEDPYPAVTAIKDHLAFYPDRVDAIEVTA
jgi:uncharacterized protein (DUF427 family)